MSRVLAEVAKREQAAKTAAEARPAPAPRPAETGEPVPAESGAAPAPRPAEEPHTEEAPGAVTAPHPVAGRVLERDGYTVVPNTVLFGVLPSLPPFDQLVYFRLYALSWGFRKTECEVSVPAIMAATGVARTQVFQILKRLEAGGLIARLGPVLGGEKEKRGNRYRVIVPGLTSPAEIRGTRAAPRPAEARDTAAAPMKESERKKGHESAPSPPAPALTVYDVRTIAARFHELHRHDPEYTRERMRQDVRTALIGEGREVDEELIERALPG